MQNRRNQFAFWRLDGDTAAQAAVDLLGRLEKQAESRHNRWLSYLRQFLGRSVTSLSPADNERCQQSLESNKNVTDSAVSTILSTTERMPLQAVFQPHGAGYGAQRTCERLTDFARGVQDSHAFRETVAQSAALDALLFGAGFVRPEWSSDDGKRAEITLRRVLPWCVFYDITEAASGQPPWALLETDLVDREVLAAAYPKAKNRINAASFALTPSNTAACKPMGGGDTNNAADLVRVLRAWRRGADGKKLTVLVDGNRGYLLESEDYTEPHFPHAPVVWQPAPVGWVLQAKSLVEQARSHQLRLDSLVEAIDISFRMAPNMLMLPMDSGIDENAVSNQLGMPVLKVAGSSGPQQFQPQPVSQQVLQQERQTIADFFDLTGVSQSQATARKPTGDMSGVALQHLSDEASVRFQSWARSYARMFGRCLEAIVECAKEASKAGYIVESGGIFGEPINFKELDLDELKYAMQVQVLPNAPRQPAQQLALAQMMLGQGLFDRDEAYALLTEFSDNRAAMRLRGAAREAVKRDVDAILRGEPRMPDSLDDAAYAYEYSRQIYLLHRDFLDDEQRTALANYREAAAAIAAANQPPAPPEGAPPIPEGAPV